MLRSVLTPFLKKSDTNKSNLSEPKPHRAEPCATDNFGNCPSRGGAALWAISLVSDLGRWAETNNLLRSEAVT